MPVGRQLRSRKLNNRHLLVIVWLLSPCLYTVFQKMSPLSCFRCNLFDPKANVDNIWQKRWQVWLCSVQMLTRTVTVRIVLSAVRLDFQLTHFRLNLTLSTVNISQNWMLVLQAVGSIHKTAKYFQNRFRIKKVTAHTRRGWHFWNTVYTSRHSARNYL